jgi:hypothetical protein
MEQDGIAKVKRDGSREGCLPASGPAPFRPGGPPTDEHREAFVEVPPLDDDTINRIADESFLEYDSREAAEDGS